MDLFGRVAKLVRLDKRIPSSYSLRSMSSLPLILGKQTATLLLALYPQCYS
jgi:hypothetical protein